jgi:hypothetical protein
VCREGFVDELATLDREGDDAAAAVGVALPASHELAALEAIEAFRHGAGRHHRGGGELARRALERGAGAAECREHVEFAL